MFGQFGLTRREIRFAFLISSSHFTQHFLVRLLPPLIPVLAVALLYPLWQLGLLISLWSLGSGLAQAPLGVLSDRYDRRFILPTGIGVVGLGFVIFAFAPTVGTPVPSVTLYRYTFEGMFLVMCGAILLTGLGSAVLHPVGYPMITDNVSVANKGKVLGLFGASSKFGDAAAPAVVAVLLLTLSWDNILLVLGVTGMLYGGGLYLALRGETYETKPSGQRTSSETSQSTDETTTDRRSFLYPMVVIYVFFIMKMLSARGIGSFLPAFLVAVYGYSLEVGGVFVGPESIASAYLAVLLLAGAVMQLILGGLTDTYDSRLVIISCMAVATIGMLTLALVPLPPAVLLVVVLVLGTGLYGVNPARDKLISDITPPEREGRTFGYIWTAVSLTGAGLPVVIGYLLEAAGMRQGFLFLSVGAALAGIAIALLYSPRIYRQNANVSPRPETTD